MAELGFSRLESSTMTSLKRCKPTCPHFLCATQWSESEPPGVCSDLSDLVLACLQGDGWNESRAPVYWSSGQTWCFSWDQRLLSLSSNDAPTVWEAERIDLPNLQVRWPPVKVPFHAHVHWQCYWRNAVSGTCYNVTMLRPTVKVVSLHKHMQIVTAGRSEWNVLRCYDVTTFCMFPLRSMSRT
jgi:hypothetical protein